MSRQENANTSNGNSVLNGSNWRQPNNARNNVDHSTTSNNNWTLCSSNVIMSIVEGRGKAKAEIGLAYIDLSSPVLNLAQVN